MTSPAPFDTIPEPAVLVWQIGYQAGKLFAASKKNPYMTTHEGKLVHTRLSIEWEDGRRLAVTEWSLKNGKPAPVWARDKIPRPIRHAV